MAEQNNTHPQQKAVDEIDIMEYVSKLWKNRSLIVKWCCIGAVVGLVVGFSLPKTYKAFTTLAPESSESGIGSNMGGLAAMMGVSVDNSADAISVEMFPDVAHSTPFIVGLFDLPVQFERGDSTINTTLVDYMFNYQRKPWWSAVIKAPFKALKWCISLGKVDKEEDVVLTTGPRDPATLTLEERELVGYFVENIMVMIDKKSGMTQIEMEMQDPLVVYTVVQAVMDHLKEYMSAYRTSKARQDVDNLTAIYNERKAEYYEAQQAYAHYVDANKNVVLQRAQAEQERLQQEMELAYQIYSQVATQLETARIKEQETKPVFVVLEPAAVPVLKAAPSKAKLLILFTFLAGCCAVVWVLFKDDLFKIIAEVTAEKEDTYNTIIK